MERCANCNVLLICNCIKMTASDGKTVCATCHTVYEERVKAGTTKP